VQHLTAGHLVSFPIVSRVGFEDRVCRVLRPLEAIRACRIADSVRLILFAARIPETELARFFIPKRVRAHHGDFFPGPFRNENRFGAHPGPVKAIRTGGVADGRAAFCLAGVPEVIPIRPFDDDRAVDIVFPTRFAVGTEHDAWRLAPMEAVLAFHHCQTALWPPGEPHAKGFTLLQNADIETGAILATDDRVAREFDP